MIREAQASNIRWHQRNDRSQLYTHDTLQALRSEEGALIWLREANK